MGALGSLFDGSGGFPLAGALSGITPLWASEIEPYPIAVTTSRFPQMKHLGNVAEVDGRKIPPVDIITFGSPCQDMSVAGKRVGMKHREKGDDATTRSGLFYEAIRVIREMREATNGRYPTFAIWENVPGAFSSNGGEDFRCVLEEFAKICGGCAIPRPANGKWHRAGEIVGDGYSIAWRLLDAQYWGVPQRRKRIYLVADFAGGRAGKILFERESVLGNPAQGGASRKSSADDSARSAGRSGGAGHLNDSSSDKQAAIYALQGNGIDRADTANFNGCGWREDVCYTLNTIDRPAICFKPGQGAKARTLGESETSAPTLASEAGGNAVPGICYPAIARTLTAEADASPCIDRGQNVVCYDTTQITSPMNYSNPKNGTPCHPLAAQQHPPLVVYDARGNGDGTRCPTLTGDHDRRISDYTNICVMAHGQSNAEMMLDMSPTLNCNHEQPIAFYAGKPPRKYIVRRLTPLECCRLQGFPDGWGAPEHKDAMDECEAAYWEGVRRTHAEIAGKTYKPFATRAALVKWYNGLHTDSAEYKMWGNGVALPCAYNLVSGCAEELRRT